MNRPLRESGGPYRPPPRRPPRRPPAGPALPRDPFAGQLNSVFGPYEAWLKKQLGSLQAEAKRKEALQRNLAQGYAEYYGRTGPQQIQGIYNQAATNQAAFGKGFSDGMQIAQQQVAADANKQIAVARGTPITVGPEAANVAYGLGGYIPANTLNAQGAAFSSAAALMPAALLAEGGKRAGQVREEYSKEISSLRGKQAELKSKKAEARIKMREAKAEAKAKAEKEAFDRSVTLAKLKLDQWKAAHPDLLVKGSATGGYFAVDPTTGKTVQIIEGTGPAPKSLQKGPNGSVFDPNTGMYYRNGKPYLPPASSSDGKNAIIDPDTGLPLTRDEINENASTARVTINSAVKKGWSISRMIETFIAEDIPSPVWGPIVSRRFGLNFNASAKQLKKMPKEKLLAIAVAYGFQRPTSFPAWGGGPARSELVEHILGARGKADAAPSGGRKNAALPLTTSPGENSEFGMADPEGAPDTKGNRYHAAKDWFASPGSPVSSPEGGVVVEVKPSVGNSGQVYGGVVKVRTRDGRVWVFRHVDPRGVRVGQRVTAGAAIASVSPWTGGSTHAHIELWKSLGGGYRFENMMDPMEWFRRFV